jgi:serralysin
MSRPTRLGFLSLGLLPLALGACLPAPKTGCRTSDDCTRGRTCVAGICQNPGLDAASDTQPDRPSPTPDTTDTTTSDLAIDLAPGDWFRVDLRWDGMLAEDAPTPPSDTPIPDRGADLGATNTPIPDGGADVGATDTPIPDGIADIGATDTPIPNGGGDVGAADTPIPDGGADVGTTDTSIPDGATDIFKTPDSAPLPIDQSPDTPLAPNDAGDGADSQPGTDAPVMVSWENFRARCPVEPWSGGRYIVDGDLAFDQAGLRLYYDAWFAAQAQPPETLVPMGAVVLWPFPESVSLSYCISSNFGDQLTVVEAAMQAAVSSWTDHVGVQVSYLPEENASCDAANTRVTFDVRMVAGAGYAAVSFFPGDPRSARSLLIDASQFGADAEAPDLAGVLRHQLGHTLGFQHEHLWLDPACTTEESPLSVQIAHYDVESVMHLPSCRPSERGGTMQTDGDLFGAIAHYGLSPALLGGILTM